MAWEPDYITVEEAKASLRIGDDADDVEIATWVTTASRTIDAHCNRQFGQLDAATAFTYTETPVYSVHLGMWFLAIDDVQDVTGLLIDGVALADTGAALWPRNAAAKGRVYTSLVWPSSTWWSPPTDAIVVTARFGWAAVPTAVQGACKLQVSRFHARRDAPYGVAGSNTDGGSELRLLARVDPDVAVALAGLSRPRRAG